MSTTITARLARLGQPSLAVPLGLLAVAAGVALAIALSLSTQGVDSASSTAAQQGDSDQLPTGAGSLPDGVVDEAREGLFNETRTDDLIDNSAAADLVSPLLERDNQSMAPASDASGLEPPRNPDDFTVIDRARE